MPVTEIAPDVYRISTFFPDINLQFNQFLIKDEEPLLFQYTKHTDNIMQKLAALKPRTVVPMHGSAYAGDGETLSRCSHA
jgi:hypothetical protein